MRWEEVGPGCLRRRYHAFDLNVGLVRGGAASLLIDTREGVREAAELVAELGEIGIGTPDFVVNTHAHLDHCLGNGYFRPASLWGHASVPGTLAALDAAALAELLGEFPRWGAAPVADPATVEVVPPANLVDRRAVLDLGDRLVELRHLGRGHTDGDLVVIVADAAVIYAGDLVEESGPPSYGGDSHPLDWPVTAGRLAAAAEAGGCAVVPGHGDVVDGAFCTEQAHLIAVVADRIRAGHAAGAGVEEMLADTGWPYPVEAVRGALLRGYAELSGASAKDHSSRLG